MAFESINPAIGDVVERFDPMAESDLGTRLEAAAAAATPWAETRIEERCALLARLAVRLREDRAALAALITREMGKLIGEAEAEIDKCALLCDHYAEHAAHYLQDEHIASDAGHSLVACQPLGVVLAVMPWNFPFWQVFRCAAPSLAAGNPVLLKHASNVPRCALAIADLFRAAGAPEGVFSTLLIEAGRVEAVIAHPAVRAVSLTGSEAAGRRVAAAAGARLKKVVLELGGSDPFVVLDDADLDLAAETAVRARFMNAGQSCIAAKRFIVVESVEAAFLERLRTGIEALQPGDPARPETTLAPMARADLRDELHEQVRASIAGGAELLLGGASLTGAGFHYAPTLLHRVQPGTPAYADELFGPVAAVLCAEDEAHALRLANDTRFGLGGSVWTEDSARGERFARRMACGAAFVNGMVKSDPRLPFGGIGDSGYGRELSRHGIQEFVNLQTIWVR